jgi:hypothetical protein
LRLISFRPFPYWPVRDVVPSPIPLFVFIVQLLPPSRPTMLLQLRHRGSCNLFKPDRDETTGRMIGALSRESGYNYHDLVSCVYHLTNVHGTLFSGLLDFLFIQVLDSKPISPSLNRSLARLMRQPHFWRPSVQRDRPPLTLILMARPSQNCSNKSMLSMTGGCRGAGTAPCSLCNEGAPNTLHHNIPLLGKP